MKLRPMITLAALALTGLSLAQAAGLAGKWTAEFDTQIGPQKYTYEFTVAGDKITGKATFVNSMASGETELKEIKLSGDVLSFVEPLHINDADISITYSGKLAGDEIKFTRNVGEFGTEELVAKRVKVEAKPEARPEAKPEVKAEARPAAAK